VIDNPLEEAAIAELRIWLAGNLDRALPPLTRLAARFQLSVVCVSDEIQRTKRERKLALQPVAERNTEEPEPAPLAEREEEFLAHVDGGNIDPDADTVHSLARKFSLSYRLCQNSIGRGQHHAASDEASCKHTGGGEWT
jgi:hypothetical protein